mgnify:FL=1
MRFYFSLEALDKRLVKNLALDKNKVRVRVDDIEPFNNDDLAGFVIKWSGNIGFGEYTIYKTKSDEKWHADSEYMDGIDDHWFLDLLLDDLKIKFLPDNFDFE